MRILLTGGTGFLGKAVLEALLASDRIERVWVLSRKLRTHPDPRVVVLVGDLTEMGALREAIVPDLVLHLAGLYQFSASYSELYLQNVVATLNLVERMKEWREQGHVVPIHHASSYAVAFRGDRLGVEDEALLGDELPPRDSPYAYTKALAERLVNESGLPARIFRLGALVDDSGQVPEKVDGPYQFLSLLQTIKKWAPQLAGLANLPIAADPNGVLPLVPLHAAAQIFARSVLELPPPASTEIYGVYRSDSINLKQFTEEALLRCGYQSKPAFFKDTPRWALRAQQRLTGVPAGVFEFATRPPHLWNPRFVSRFGADSIPEFDRFKEGFFS